MKKVIVVHGWDSSPSHDWFPWLDKTLKEKGYEVIIPEMPDSSCPKIENWVPFLEKAVGEVNEDTYFIGHSIGCQTILRFLEKIDTRVGGCLFVAGWFELTLDTDEEKEIAKPWETIPINLEKAKNNAGKIISIFSDNDPWVPKSNWKKFESLGSEIVILKGLGHISEGDGVTEFTPLLKVIKCYWPWLICKEKTVYKYSSREEISMLLQLYENLKIGLLVSYNLGSNSQKALLSLAELQYSLISSYLRVFDTDTRYLVGRAVLLRTILENQGCIIHIRNNEVRSKKYLEHDKEMFQQLKNGIDLLKGRTCDEAIGARDQVWSSSKIQQRVKLVDETGPILYDMLSNFTHGNNVFGWFDLQGGVEMMKDFSDTIDRYLSGIYIGLISEIQSFVELDDKNRSLISETFDKIFESKPKNPCK